MATVEGDRKLASSNNRRFNSSGKAAKEIYDGFNAWSSLLTTRSIEVSFAIVAANWAVHGSKNDILHNFYSKWSLIIVIIFFGVNLLGTLLMTKLHDDRCHYIDENKIRWDKEYTQAAAEPSPWPYTNGIELLGAFLRVFKGWVPVIAGVLFVISLFTK